MSDSLRDGSRDGVGNGGWSRNDEKARTDSWDAIDRWLTEPQSICTRSKSIVGYTWAFNSRIGSGSSGSRDN